MEINTIIDAGMQAFKQKIMDICKNTDVSTMTPSFMEEMTAAIKTAASSAGLA
jgi:hypothetical protein